MLKNNIIIDSVPSSSELYDRLWVTGGPINPFSDNRNIELFKLILPQSYARTAERKVKEGNPKAAAEDFISLVDIFRGKKVLDACAGSGNMSIAAIEAGAAAVAMLDGSLGTLEQFEKRLNKHGKKLVVPIQLFENNIFRVQADMDSSLASIEPKTFDVSFCRYAVMHTQNPFLTIAKLASVTRPGGYICFNCFDVGCTPYLVRILRVCFKDIPLQEIHDFLKPLGKTKRGDPVYELKDLLGDNPRIKAHSEIHQQIIDALNQIALKYSIDDIEKYLHYEDLACPYIHNLSGKQVLNWAKNNLHLEPVEALDIRAEKNVLEASEFTLLLRVTEEFHKSEYVKIPKIPEEHELWGFTAVKFGDLPTLAEWEETHEPPKNIKIS